VKDVPSRGRRHRIYSVKFGRVLHCMSDLERNGIYGSEVCTEVTGNTEQVPLDLSVTQAIAREMGYAHPRAPGARHDNVMTTDQVWTIATPQGPARQPISCKYRADIANPRVAEKNAIEAEYWRRQPGALPLRYFDEFSVSADFVSNWDLIRATLRPGYFKSFPTDLVGRTDHCLRHSAQAGRLPLSDLTSLAAGQLNVGKGEVLTAIHYLLASQTWMTDLDGQKLRPSLRLKIETKEQS
jgi:hypothetical protein